MADVKEFGDGLALLERRDSLAIVTLNRPERRNAITHALRKAILDAFRFANLDRSIRAVVLTGAGGHFCGGGDLSGMDDRDVASVHERMRMAADVVRAIRRAPKPYVAAVEGSAFGAGLSLPLACDYIVAAQSARLCAIFVKAGLVPDYGLMHTLPRRVGEGRARHMMMVGNPVDAPTAHSIGLVDELVADGMALEAALVVAGEMGSNAPLSIQFIKSTMAEGGADHLESCLDSEAHIQAQLFQSEDFEEGIAAFTCRRAPNFKGR